MIALRRELGVWTIRYPGGNFVSGYRWEDGVGPRENRPAAPRPRLALDGDQRDRARRVRALAQEGRQRADVRGEPRHARGVREALDVLEYANIRSGTSCPSERIANGARRALRHPDVVPGQRDGRPLAARPQDAAGVRAARGQDRAARCGRSTRPSSSWSAAARAPRCRTFGDWERVVLEETYDEVDYISCHAYYEPRTATTASFLASAANMDRFIDSVVATADHVKALRGSDKTINISFDEWNVWYQSRYAEVDRITGVDDWPVAPRLLEDAYSVADAVVFGSLLISLLRHADRVTSASLAQLVNVIAPIMTEPGGPAWRQTTFFPFAADLAAARGAWRSSSSSTARPTTPRCTARSASSTPSRRTTRRRAAPTVFMVNRSLTEAVELTVDVGTLGEVAVADARSAARRGHPRDEHAGRPERGRPQREHLALARRRPRCASRCRRSPWTVLTLR